MNSSGIGSSRVAGSGPNGCPDIPTDEVEASGGNARSPAP